MLNSILKKHIIYFQANIVKKNNIIPLGIKRNQMQTWYISLIKSRKDIYELSGLRVPLGTNTNYPVFYIIFLH